MVKSGLIAILALAFNVTIVYCSVSLVNDIDNPALTSCLSEVVTDENVVYAVYYHEIQGFYKSNSVSVYCRYPGDLEVDEPVESEAEYSAIELCIQKYTEWQGINRKIYYTFFDETYNSKFYDEIFGAFPESWSYESDDEACFADNGKHALIKSEVIFSKSYNVTVATHECIKALESTNNKLYFADIVNGTTVEIRAVMYGHELSDPFIEKRLSESLRNCLNQNGYGLRFSVVQYRPSESTPGANRSRSQSAEKAYGDKIPKIYRSRNSCNGNDVAAEEEFIERANELVKKMIMKPDFRGMIPYPIIGLFIKAYIKALGTSTISIRTIILNVVNGESPLAKSSSISYKMSAVM